MDKKELRLKLFKENIKLFYRISKNHLGLSKYHDEFPTLIIHTELDDNELMGGYFDFDHNELEINYQGWDDSKYCYEHYAKLVYHEFIHYHQCPGWFTRYNKKYDYHDHPYEKEAYSRESEILDLIDFGTIDAQH